MKIKDGFVLKKIGQDTVVLDARGDTVDMTSGIVLNSAAELLFGALLKDTDSQALSQLLVDSYGITPERAKNDVKTFVLSIEEKGLLEK